MFEREMMITGLRKQRSLLAQWVQEIEQKEGFKSGDIFCSQDKARQVSSNLKKLRKIKNSYVSFQENLQNENHLQAV